MVHIHLTEHPSPDDTFRPTHELVSAAGNVQGLLRCLPGIGGMDCYTRTDWDNDQPATWHVTRDGVVTAGPSQIATVFTVQELS